MIEAKIASGVKSSKHTVNNSEAHGEKLLMSSSHAHTMDQSSSSRLSQITSSTIVMLNNRLKDAGRCLSRRQRRRSWKLHTSFVYSFFVLTILLTSCLPTVTAMYSGPCSLRTIAVTLRQGQCRRLTLITTACIGSCHSYTATSIRDPSMFVRHCTCCREVETVTHQITLRCPKRRGRGYRNRLFSVSRPTSCSCRPCDDVPSGNELIPGEHA